MPNRLYCVRFLYCEGRRKSWASHLMVSVTITGKLWEKTVCYRACLWHMFEIYKHVFLCFSQKWLHVFLNKVGGKFLESLICLIITDVYLNFWEITLRNYFPDTFHGDHFITTAPSSSVASVTITKMVLMVLCWN